MEDDARKVKSLSEEVERLKWRIATLEAAEYECARALSALAESEARYRRLLDEAGLPITISTTTDSIILFANPLACAQFGLEGPRPSGRRILEFYSNPSDRADLVDRLRVFGTVRDREILMLDGKGHSHSLIVTASLISFEGQEAVLATSNDITDRRHAEALFRTLVEVGPDGFALSDLEGFITYVSPQAVEVFGYSQPEEILGRNLMEFAPYGEHARMAERLLAMLKGDYAGPSEFTGVRKDGSTFPQETNGKVLQNPDGSPHAFFFIIRDLTNRKRLERALRWGEKLESLGLMAAGIAHELNNTFQVTQGHLEIAQGLGPGSGPSTDVLSGIGAGMDRAKALAREMLDYSGRTLRGDAPLDLGQVVEEGLALWRDLLVSGSSLAYVPGGALPPVQADEGQVLKVFSAFVLNAIEAMAERTGSVQITTEVQELGEAELSTGFWPAPGRAGHFLRLEVRDSGVGIPTKLLERVCDPFFTTKGQGRGLGLSAALGILRSHSACLQLLSQPGEGTVVRAYFPISHQAPSALPPGKDAGPAVSGILVAEDEDSIRDLVVRMLARWGYEPVIAARNGAEALELFRVHQEAIGIFLTDATMPQMSGPEAFEAMRKLSPSLHGILMTGYSESFGQGTASAYGFSGYLNKPFRFHDLKAALDSVRSGPDATSGS